jgi:hypothetical protein
MKHPFKAAASVLLTGAVSFVLSNLLPWGYNFTGFDKHHGYGYPLFTVLGLLVPIVAVVLAAFLLSYGLFISGEDNAVTAVFLGGGYDDEPDVRLLPASDQSPVDATVDGPDLDGL